MLQICSFNVSILTVIIYFMYAHECFASVYVFVPDVCVPSTRGEEMELKLQVLGTQPMSPPEAVPEPPL